MSFFYLTAVKGHIPVHIIEVIASERFCYLKAIMNEDYMFYNEYVNEGSVYDNVGHFLLCIAAIVFKSYDFSSFLVKSEGDLFKRRTNILNSYELRCFSKKILKNIKKLNTTPHFMDALKVLCEHLMVKNLAQHVSSPMHSYDCSNHNIQLNFRHCLPLIAKRQVEIKNGIAFLPCGRWKQFFLLLFYANLNHRLTTTNLEALKLDPRISELLSKLEGEITRLLGKSYTVNVLLSKNVDGISSYFPPCMLNLHQQLRQKHRLSHYQRFYYSLFLKDIGMPIGEAINFWRLEYQKNPSGTHSCCHNWERDEKKFLYGIRHMYGLEGCRKSYASVNCQKIQSEDCSCSEGGCPFKVFEFTKLQQILNITEKNSLWSQIIDLKSKQCYTSACVKYLQSVLSNKRKDCDIQKESFSFTAVKYYNLNVSHGIQNDIDL